MTQKPEFVRYWTKDIQNDLVHTLFELKQLESIRDSFKSKLDISDKVSLNRVIRQLKADRDKLIHKLQIIDSAIA